MTADIVLSLNIYLLLTIRLSMNARHTEMGHELAFCTGIVYVKHKHTETNSIHGCHSLGARSYATVLISEDESNEK